jgi:GntR family transcriptional repressor for pyruvate dehydrogenase complex
LQGDYEKVGIDMFKSVNDERKTFSKKVVDHIQELILSGQLQPGNKLPPERELAERMNVSRPTIREAFKILSAMGYLTIKHGNGVFVSNQTERIGNMASLLFIQSDTIHELFEVRKTLETESAAWAAKRGTAQFLQQISIRTKEVFDILQEDHFENQEAKETFLFESDEEFHLMVAEAAGNEVVLRIMNNLIDLLRESRLHSMKIPGRSVQSLLEHIEIAEALIDGDAELSRKRMFKHLSSVERDLIDKIDS